MSIWTSLLALVGLSARAPLAMDAGNSAPKGSPRPDPRDFDTSLPSSAKREFVNPFLPALRNCMPPGVRVPPEVTMAMDSAGPLLSEQAAWAMGALNAAFDGQREGFQGYPELAIRATIPEYRAIIEIKSQEATRKWIEFSSVGDKDKTDRIKELTDEIDRLKVRTLMREISEQDGKFGRAHVYVDLKAAKDGDDIDELKIPIGDGRDDLQKAKIGKGSLVGFRTVEAVWVWPLKYESLNPLKPDWYRPTTWLVMSLEVHASRLLTFISRPVSDLLKPAYMFGGQSDTQITAPVVENWLRTRGGVGNLINAFSTPVFATDVTSKMSALGAGAAALLARIDAFNLFRSNSGTFVIDKEKEDLKNVSVPLGTLDKLQAQSQEHMASLARTPGIKLFGIQPAGLNASSDGELTAHSEHIESYQNAFYGENLTIIVDIVMSNLWGAPDKDIVYKFVALETLNELERADLANKRADTAGKHIANKALTSEEERARVAADPDEPYSSIDVDEKVDMTTTEGGALVTAVVNAIASIEGTIIDKATALRGLQALNKLTGLGPEIDDKLIKEAEEEPPAPDPNMMGGDPNAPGGPGGPGGGQPGEGGPQQGNRPKAQSSTDPDEDDHSVVWRDGSLAQDANWEEGKHKRGQPENKGQFGAGGGSSGGGAPPKPRLLGTPESRAEARENAPTNSASEEVEKTEVDKKSPAASLMTKYADQSGAGADPKAIGARIAESVGVSQMLDEVAGKLAKGVPTSASKADGGHIGPDGKWTEERAALHEKLLTDLFSASAIKNATPFPTQKPTVALLGGRGGSGKSWLTGKDGPVDKSKSILIDADSFKQALPEYEGWNAALLHEESDYLVNRSAEIASELGLNVIFDATLKSESTVLKRIEQFTDTHDVHGYYMFASPETACARAMMRFKRGTEKDGKGRYVPPEVIMANRDNEKNFDAAIPKFAKWGVYDNNSGSGPQHVASGGGDE